MSNRFRGPIEVDGGGYLYTDGKTWSAASSDGMWLPGIYADEVAARKALQVFDEHYDELRRLVHWTARGEGDDYRPVTVADLDGIGACP
jgi:hypothetical protein